MGNIRVPKYRRQARQGRPDDAFVVLGGKRRYCGEYGTPEAKAEYGRLVAEYQANGGRPAVEPDALTVVELVDRYWHHALDYYRKPDGSPTSQVDFIRQALRPVKALYGHTPAAEFGPKALRALREQWIGAGLARRTVNGYVAEVRRMFKWAVSHELLPAPVHQALATLDGLRRGRSAAKETDSVKPVPAADVEAVKSCMPDTLRDMVDLHILTGMRPGELVALRGSDIDTNGRVWTYKPTEHKTAWHGHERIIYIGPKAQEIVGRHLSTDLSAHLFSPRKAMEERWAQAEMHRRKGQKPNRRKTTRRVRDHYTADTYRRAIERACDEAFPPPAQLARADGESVKAWHGRLDKKQQAALRQWQRDHRWSPNQLRHNAASRLRREFGIDLAQTILGHRLGSQITEVYSEANHSKAQQIIAKIG